MLCERSVTTNSNNRYTLHLQYHVIIVFDSNNRYTLHLQYHVIVFDSNILKFRLRSYGSVRLALNSPLLAVQMTAFIKQFWLR